MLLCDAFQHDGCDDDIRLDDGNHNDDDDYAMCGYDDDNYDNLSRCGGDNNVGNNPNTKPRGAQG